MKETHLLTREQKLSWGDGEWLDEPDLVEFEHLGLKCKIMRMHQPYGNGYYFGGNLNGYVCVPLGHPLHGVDCFKNEIDIDVHGELTFSNIFDDDWWFGFDCAHAYDIIPSMQKIERDNREKSLFMKEMYEEDINYFDIGVPAGYSFLRPTYKNLSFVIGETQSLAKQLSTFSAKKLENLTAEKKSL